ncbi:MAG: M28 family peptidase [Salinivirgaceae bacterium]|nr:M28 family peptidase [Salinivirgaceae bacterium]
MHNENDPAADYIKQRLEKYGLTVDKQYFNDDGINVIATQLGGTNPDSIFMICGHYDAVTDYAADDNASGTAAVIEIARILSKIDLNYTLIYALWDEEEIGLLGSEHYTANLAIDESKFIGVLNFDMLAYDSDNDGVFDIHAGADSESLRIANTMVSVINSHNLDLDPTIYSPGISYSDHSPFWEVEIGAILMIESYMLGDFTWAYHTVDDRIDLFNMAYFHEMVKAGMGTTVNLTMTNIDTRFDQEAVLAQNTMEIYPNPSNGIFNFRTNTTSNVEVINQFGSLVAQLNITDNNTEIDLSSFANGIYYVKVYGNTPQVLKIIKQ